VEEAIDVPCPHCGAATTLFVDPSAGTRQEFIEDCQVCCRPIVFRVTWRGRQPRVAALPQDG
jgi:hypothetical protein